MSTSPLHLHFPSPAPEPLTAWRVRFSVRVWVEGGNTWNGRWHARKKFFLRVLLRATPNYAAYSDGIWERSTTNRLDTLKDAEFLQKLEVEKWTRQGFRFSTYTTIAGADIDASCPLSAHEFLELAKGPLTRWSIPEDRLRKLTQPDL